MSGKILAITGVSGYFGQALLPLLDADPAIEKVAGFDLVPPDPNCCQKLTFHQIDIRDPQIEPLLAGCDTLVHLAFRVMRLPGRNDLDEVNIIGTRHICEAAARQRVRKLVITSSVVAYGMHPDNPVPLTEESPLRPNPGLYYGKAKAANESYYDEYVRRNPGMIVTRLRPCTVVGPKAERSMMASFLGDTGILVKGYNPPYQLLHENDLASALHLAIQNDLPGVYNVASDEPLTLREIYGLRGIRVVSLPFPIAQAVMGLLWRVKASVFAPEWLDLTRYSLVASNEKLKKQGWQPRYTTAQAYFDLLRSHAIEIPSAAARSL